MRLLSSQGRRHKSQSGGLCGNGMQKKLALIIFID